ncbi:MAG: hypothetical protein NVS3B21_07590 [Acidimicrobiales bacterium]
MDTQAHPYALLLAAATVVAVATGRAAWHRRSASEAALPLTALLAGVALWSGAYAMSWSVTSRGAELGFLDATYIGVGIVPVAFLIFSLRLRGSTWPGTQASLGWLAVGPFLGLVAASVNPAHLFYPHVAVATIAGRAELAWTRGPLFWANAAYAYVLLAASYWALARGISSRDALRRRQRATALAAATIPLLANVATETGLVRISSLDVTPVAFTATAAIFAWSIFHQRLLDVVPVARHVLVETMADGVVVIDHRGRIADLNPAAARLVRSIWPTADSNLLGFRVVELWSDWTAIGESADGLVTRHVGPPVGGKDLEIQVTHLIVPGQVNDGALLVIRDVTERNAVQSELLAANAALRLKVDEIERLRMRLAEEAIRDPLTGLYNRRHFDEVLETILARAERDGSPVSLVLLDVDHFKDLNDRWGHAAGDRVLQHAGAALRRSTRAGDVACRWGGEEFVLILPGATTAQAMERAAEWIGVSTAASDGNPIAYTLSAGVSTYPADGTATDDLFRNADRALYGAKRSGRARAVAASALASDV